MEPKPGEKWRNRSRGKVYEVISVDSPGSTAIPYVVIQGTRRVYVQRSNFFRKYVKES